MNLIENFVINECMLCFYFTTVTGNCTPLYDKIVHKCSLKIQLDEGYVSHGKYLLIGTRPLH